jgi:hypothetical protein
MSRVSERSLGYVVFELAVLGGVRFLYFVQSTVHPSITHQHLHCQRQNTSSPIQRPSADHSQIHSDNFDNFLRRLAFAWTSTLLFIDK